jgi:phosphoserine aminotransferase
MLTLRWLKKSGGVTVIEKINTEKAKLLYDAIDNTPVFKGTVAGEDRSKMNVCFLVTDPALEKEFLEECKQNGIVGIKGHRTTGGFRVSLYNAMPLSGVQVLTELMTSFANRK